MVAILEKSEHNVDFHLMVDFVEASPLRTVTESSLMRNLKLQDEEGISSLPDMKLFENLTLMGYNISPNQKFTFQKGQFSHQWKYLIHTIMQCLSPKSKGFNEFSSNITTALVCLDTNRTYNFSKMIFDGLVKNVNNKVSKFLMYPRFLTMCLRMNQFGQITHTHTVKAQAHQLSPHHTPSPVAQLPSHTTHSSPTIPSVSTVSIPLVTSSDTPPIRLYTRRTRIAQSLILPPVADEPASPLRDVSQGEACPTDSGFLADQDMAIIAKSSTLPHDSAPRVTSPVAAEGKGFRDDAPIKGRNLDKGEAAAERVSDDTEEMATVLTSMDAATVLASRVAEVSTGSGSIPTIGPPAAEVPTGSDVVPTASPVFATAIVVTPYRRRKGKEVMTQQRKQWSKKQKRDYYMAVIRSNLGWKVKDFRGMSFKEIKSKFTTVWKQLEDFIPMGSKEEAERLKRKGLSLEQKSAKKFKPSDEVPKEVKSPDEVPEDKRSYWKIIRLGGSSAIYQFFVDQLKHMDREDLNQLWALVKESLGNRPPTSDKEMELWLYDMCGVHQVTSKDKEIFMLVEKDYPLRKGLALVMISYKLQVENYSQMENDLILKIYKISNSPRQQEEVPTASEESSHCQKKRDATAKRISLLTIVGTSTTEAEYVAAASCCGQVLWIQN
nr:glutamic acid-rich protein-like [Tanacetum cinerariifolium]